jgi:hypothetical protein
MAVQVYTLTKTCYVEEKLYLMHAGVIHTGATAPLSLVLSESQPAYIVPTWWTRPEVKIAASVEQAVKDYDFI